MEESIHGPISDTSPEFSEEKNHKNTRIDGVLGQI
jgi:hypothetical protein